MNCSDWIAIVDVVITAILTAIIIFQTHKLNKKQLDFERRVSQRDEDLQKRQIQIDTFSDSQVSSLSLRYISSSRCLST